jgi:ABC-2 type transport system ATP-binding protein/lipopolysaccharide transport system ATP-binding protein
MGQIAIDVRNVTMVFNLARDKTDSLKEYFVKRIKKQIHHEEFYALQNVSFQVEKGSSFALIGANGSGKSTMLKIIAGIYRPTKGSVEINGNIAPLIELGSGFDGDLTAEENIYLNGALLGRNRKMMAECFESIMDFAELWDFRDVPHDCKAWFCHSDQR